MSLGWSWDEAREQLDIPRLNALHAYWRHNPPMHVLLKAYVGYKPSSPSGLPSDVDAAATPVTTASELIDTLITSDESHG